MTTRQPRYSAEETARRGDEIYERDIRAQVEGTHRAKVVAIDIDSGEYVIDDNALTPKSGVCALAIERCTASAGAPCRGRHDHGRGQCGL